jgi:diaminohydroxyphosphoribosylaminopyrimidine deaminase / 5-amino-6-(5-phosphoribosylamino)uracil reductase
METNIKTDSLNNSFTYSELYMRRALELALLGLGSASPNPMVGCVIVHNDKIIGEGWHQKYGEAHAEVNAINSTKDKSILSESTVYVTLEPCSHFGKTPPCADLLIKHQVKKVVVCNTDPFPLVAGRGIEKLQNAGIEVEIGLLAEQGRKLNRRFFTKVEKGRPYIILKWAETADGFIANENFEALRISSEYSQMYSHKWRSEEDAIMIGTNTAQYDNPNLTVRNWTGRNPTRIVLDLNKRLDKNLTVFNDEATTVLIDNDEWRREKGERKKGEGRMMEGILSRIVEKIPSGSLGAELGSIIVEGGTRLLQSFIDEGLFDEIRLFKNRQLFIKKGIKSPNIQQVIFKNIQQVTDELTIYRV